MAAQPARRPAVAGVAAYSTAARVAAAALQVVAVSSLLLLAVLVLLSSGGVNPLKLMRTFSLFVLIPWLAARALQRACFATARIEDGALVLERRGRRTELPVASIAAAEPWSVPLPAGGFWLSLKSSRRFRDGLASADPAVLLDSLAQAGAPEQVRASAAHPTLRYERFKNAARSRWDHPLVKFVVFSLVPTLPLFRVHQIIAYGGLLGEYYQYGLKAYVLAFGIYWATLAIYLVLFATVLRVLVETVAWPAAWIAPSRASRVRSAVEVAGRVLFYGGVPVLVILRFWPW